MTLFNDLRSSVATIAGKLILTFLILFFFHFNSRSQNLNWAFKAGGTGRDEASFTHIDNAGNVLLTGFFSGTADFDPSAAVFNLTSAGSEDIFVAKYTPAGQFIWAFRIGGSNRDWSNAITTDQNDNVIITGFFRGSNVDFDPSATVANLTSNGDAGSDPGYGGDIFLAKYNSAGQYQWAFNMGGSQLYDSGVAVATDGSSNIYIGAYFRETVDFDPSPAVFQLNSATGTIVLGKYSPAGNFQWAFNLGLGDNDNAIFDLKIDNSGNVYAAGYFQGTNIDFDPSPATALLNSSGGYEIFFAKYTTNGQYVFAHRIGGTGTDVARGIELDNNGNIYIIGDFNGSNIDFDPGAGTAPLTSNGNADVFLAKYNNSGNYVWAFNFGAGANDIGWKLSTDNTHLFVTGGFTGTTDMNPSPTVDNLVSNGGNDIFLGKYNLDGEYLCAFNIGGSLDDYGSAIRTSGTNTFYLTGYFQGSNVDFDPTTSSFPLSSNGGSDVFLTKFNWPDNTPPAGTLSGSVVCSSQQPTLTFTATAGTGPFTIVYSNGTTNVTVNNIQSGVPFTISPTPTTTTIYSLVSIRDAARCSETAMAGDTALVTVNILDFDFNYSQNVCNPLSVQFFPAGTLLANPYWSLGDGNISNNPSPIHVYSTTGNYVVKYALTNGICTDTVAKIISIDLIQDNIILTPDTVICKGATKKLRTVPSLNFCWTPSTYLDNPNLQEPTTSTPQAITYYYTAEVTGNNIIVNGNFSGGNSGFTSDYTSAATNTAEGQYFVGTNPSIWNAAFNNCNDHTTGNGNMMIVNGVQAVDGNVWKETLAVLPNTNYAFSMWILCLQPNNPAQVQFSINGKNIGGVINANTSSCNWVQFSTTWNSGNNTTASISIVNRITVASGNDFALDDISFAPVFIKRDSVRISVDSPFVRTNNDTTVCEGSAVQLNSIGAQTYSWSPASGLSNGNIANPIATVTSSTQYIVSGTNATGCTAKDTVLINVNPKPLITATNDTSICRNTSVQIFASGGVNYSWGPASTLSNSAIANPVATPSANTTYYVTVTDNNNCSNTDSVKVGFLNLAQFSASSALSVCQNSSVQLNASGGDIYSWSPSSTLSNSSIADPIASPLTSTIYSVTIFESSCNESATLTVPVNVLPLPIVDANRSNDIDCIYDFAKLSATGARTYSWSPAGTLNNSNLSNPIARPAATTQYVVKGIDANGCENYDSVIVKVDYSNKGLYLMANAFTPNNDGFNDCFGVKYWGTITELEFNIYNRWGELVFKTTDPTKCWDGTFKGLKQTGVFVFWVRAKTTCDNSVFRKGTVVLIR